MILQQPCRVAAEIPLGADVGPDAEVHVEAGVGDGLDERGQVLAALEVVLPYTLCR